MIMNGYVSRYRNGYSNRFNVCLCAELTTTATVTKEMLENTWDKCDVEHKG